MWNVCKLCQHPCRARNVYSKEQLKSDFLDGIKEMEQQAGNTVKAAARGMPFCRRMHQVTDQLQCCRHRPTNVV